MTACSYPPSLTPDQISAAIDGNAESAVYEHLAQCAGCAAELLAAQEIEHRLTRELHRWDCPTLQQLGDYHLERIGEPEVEEAISLHVRHCPHCTAELAGAHAFLTAKALETQSRAPALAPQPSRSSLGDLIARLVASTSAPAMRGGGVSEPIVAEVDGLVIVLEMEPGTGGRVTIAGQIATEEQDRWTGALVQVRQGGQLKMMTMVNDLGSFRCKAILPAVTEIRITPAVGQTVVMPDVHIPH